MATQGGILGKTTGSKLWAEGKCGQRVLQGKLVCRCQEYWKEVLLGKWSVNSSGGSGWAGEFLEWRVRGMISTLFPTDKQDTVAGGTASGNKE